MNPEIKARWVQALRSGEFTQGVGHLRTGDEYCCLGVLCEIAVADGIVTRVDSGEHYSYGIGHSEGFNQSVLPPAVVAWAGLDDDSPEVGLPAEFVDDPAFKGLGSLAEFNDVGMPFDKIANVIEEQL